MREIYIFTEYDSHLHAVVVLLLLLLYSSFFTLHTTPFIPTITTPSYQNIPKTYPKHHLEYSFQENPLFNVFVHQKKKLSDLNEKTVNGFFTTNNANFCKNGAQFLQNLLKSDCFSSEVIMKGLKQKNSHGRTMFQECIVKGDLPSFKVLLAYLTTRQSSETLSWFVNDVENQKNRTALHLSVVYKQFHMFKMLVESIPGIAKLDATDSDGKTALDIAKDTNQDNVVELFNEMAELQKPKKKKGFGLKSLFSRNKSKNK